MTLVADIDHTMLLDVSKRSAATPVAATLIATPVPSARRGSPSAGGAHRPHPSRPGDRSAARREAVGLLPTVAAATEAIVALRGDGFAADEIGVLAAAEIAGAAAAITSGGIAYMPSLGAFWIAASLQPASDDASRGDSSDDPLLGAGLAYWLVRHSGAIPARGLRGEVVLITVLTGDADREAAALALPHRHGASGVRIYAID